jgi:phosphohistidine phosphatase SixA
MICHKRLIRHLILLIWLLGLPFPVYAQQALSDQALIEALRLGGYNLYFRHEATEWSQQDVVHQKDDWVSCDGAKIRQLSEQGRQRAKRTGEVMRSLNIPVSEVLASPYCRTMETARQLALGHVQASIDVVNLRIAEYFGGKEAIIATARRLLALPPVAGSNRVIVAHGNVAQAATPVYPGEGEMVIFKPDDKGNFTFVGRIAPDQWFQIRQAN